ncbi:MAG: hypothetical protein ABFR62_00545 [Bacteroidota bacterium]
MKISNTRVKFQYASIYVAFLLVFALNLFDDNVSGRYGNSIENGLLIFIFLIISFLLIWRGFPFFEYDSEGEVLVIKSSEPVLISKLSDNQFFAEFPKAKLNGFKIKSSFFRRTLYLHLNGDVKTKTLKVSISCLNKNEVLLLSQSLKNALRNCKKEVINEQRPLRRGFEFG